MQALIRSQVDPLEPMDLSVASYENMCPACYTALPKRLESCTQCSAPFKTPRKAMLRSLFLPGWGDIYLGHRMLGCFELLGSLVIWLIVFTFLMSGQIDGVIPGLFLLLVYNGVDSILTYFMAQKGYSLEKHRKTQQFTGANPKTTVPELSG
jgi:hypothetical protein